VKELHSYSHRLLYSVEPEFITSLHLLDNAEESVGRGESGFKWGGRSILQAILKMVWGFSSEKTQRNIER
jgi:hypothetical protein